MKVYHGSYIKIESIDFSKCKLYRDFGRGFYVTKLLEQAAYWAERKGRNNKDKGFITEFDFAESAFENWEFNVIRFNNYTEEWLDFVIENRNQNNLTPVHDFDIVEGPVANDDVAKRIDDFLDGTVSKSDFLDELKFRFPTHQICFCSHRSLQALKPVDKKIIKTNDDTIVEALISEWNISEKQAIDMYYSSKTYARLIDESTGLYKKTWFDIYRILLQELIPG